MQIWTIPSGQRGWPPRGNGHQKKSICPKKNLTHIFRGGGGEEAAFSHKFSHHPPLPLRFSSPIFATGPSAWVAVMSRGWRGGGGRGELWPRNGGMGSWARAEGWVPLASGAVSSSVNYFPYSVPFPPLSFYPFVFKFESIWKNGPFPFGWTTMGLFGLRYFGGSSSRSGTTRNLSSSRKSQR